MSVSKTGKGTPKAAPNAAINKEENNMAKTDTVKSNGGIKEASPPIIPQTDDGEGATGKLELVFDVPVPARKPLGRPAGDGGQWGKIVDALAKVPGKQAQVYTSTEYADVNVRRNTILFAAERKGVELDLSKLNARDTGKKDAQGRTLFGLWAAVATKEVAEKQKAARAARDAKREADAKAKGFKSYAEMHEAEVAKRKAMKEEAAKLAAATAKA